VPTGHQDVHGWESTWSQHEELARKA
jgi:hypothetical protein